MKRFIKKVNPNLLEIKRHFRNSFRESEKENEIIKLSTKDKADYTHKRLYFILIIFGVFYLLIGKATQVILNLRYFESDFSLTSFLIPVISLCL
ncbi:hypothetical protein [Brevibacillus laterosporus]|nr:hypothetical protein [Brevibacillus laterosporus]MBM7111872.1 hypothetical protein [Brevibacillus laterosporus]